MNNADYIDYKKTKKMKEWIYGTSRKVISAKKRSLLLTTNPGYLILLLLNLFYKILS